MLLAHKIALDPNKNQEIYFAKAAGTARFAYNWALCEWKRQYELHKKDKNLPKPSWVSLNKQLNEIKHKEYPWMSEVASCIPTQAIMQLNNAFSNFFRKKNGYPKPRKKGIDDRFTLNNTQFRISDSRIYISKLGWIKMRESLRFDGKIMSATISRVADRWFVSILVEFKDNPYQQRTESQGAVGVDLGIASLATLSTGEKIKGPKPHTALLKKLRKLSRKLSRKKKGSKNRNKARIKLARLHLRISNIRNDAMHKLTTHLVRKYGVICIEDLNVKGMMKNRNLSRSIADMSFYEFKRQLLYKAALYDGKIAVIDRFFPSSKTCSECGYKNENLPLSVREWACPGCGVVHDRDINAARNILKFGLATLVNGSTASSAGCNACGEEGSGHHLAVRKVMAKPASVKQEASYVE